MTTTITTTKSEPRRNKVTLKAAINSSDYEVLKAYAEKLGISLSAFVRLDLGRTADTIRNTHKG
jgi:hypothetical protein